MELIKEIHDRVYKAEKALEERVLSQDETVLKKASEDLHKVKDAGFINIGNQDPHWDYIVSELQFNKIQKLKAKYPLIKFIAERDLLEVCSKYNLVIGWPSIFRGEIPAKNLKEIADFKMEDVDLYSLGDNFGIRHNIINFSFSGPIGMVVTYDGIYLVKEITIDTVTAIPTTTGLDLPSLGDIIAEKVSKEVANEIINSAAQTILPKMQTAVVATADHFGIMGQFTAGRYISDYLKYKTEETAKANDPIVLKRTKYKDIFAIVTAWGDEAYDPAILNEIYN